MLGNHTGASMAKLFHNLALLQKVRHRFTPLEANDPLDYGNAKNLEMTKWDAVETIQYGEQKPSMQPVPELEH